jgi:hypothetical protein
VAQVKSQPYVPQAGGLARIDNPVHRSRVPGLSVDYETRELVLSETMRIPLEGVSWYDLEPEKLIPVGNESPTPRRTWSPERRAKYEASKK